MLNQLLETIIQILTGWVDKFTSHAQHVEDKLDSLDQTASDIETNTEPISDIADNTGAVITPIQNIKSNTDSIKQSSQTSTNNTTAILNNISTLSTNTGRAAAYAQDCANNTLDIKDKITTIASDTTQLRADSAELNDMSDKIYEAIKWSLVDKVITETVEGTDTVSFDTDLTNDLVSLEVSIEPTQTGSGTPSPDNVRPITGVTNKSITINGNNVIIAFGQTVYGGVLDVIRGKLRVDRSITLVTETSLLIKDSDLNSYHRFYFRKDDVLKQTDYVGHIIASACPTVNNYYYFGGFDGEMAVTAYSITSKPENYLYIISKSLSTVAEVQAQFAEEPLQIVYELATPIEIQLTPSQIATIKGINTIITDGNISLTYDESVKHYLDKQDN